MSNRTNHPPHAPLHTRASRMSAKRELLELAAEALYDAYVSPLSTPEKRQDALSELAACARNFVRVKRGLEDR